MQTLHTQWGCTSIPTAPLHSSPHVTALHHAIQNQPMTCHDPGCAAATSSRILFAASLKNGSSPCLYARNALTDYDNMADFISSGISARINRNVVNKSASSSALSLSFAISGEVVELNVVGAPLVRLATYDAHVACSCRVICDIMSMLWYKCVHVA